MLSGAIPRIQLPPVPKFNSVFPDIAGLYPLANILVLLGLFVLALIPALYLGWNNIGVFNSPDETAAYMTAQAFAEDGRLYIQDDLTLLNPESPIGPRGFAQQDGRSVPIYPLGHPFFLGVVHKVFGSAAPIVLAVIPALTILSLAAFLKIINPKTPAYLGFAFLGVAPLWYWTSFVYMNVAVTMLFASISLPFFAMAIRNRSFRWFFLTSSALGVAALMRHSEAPLYFLIGIAFAIAFIRRNGPFTWTYSLAVLGLYAGAQFAMFLMPMFVLNWMTYGSPFITGYHVFYEQEFPGRLSEAGNPIMSIFNTVRLAFFPQPIDLNVLVLGLKSQVVLMVPFIVVLGITGLVLGRKSLLRLFGYAGILLLAVIFLYVLVSRSDPLTYQALATEPDIRASLVRYWLPIYIALGIGTAYTLSRAPNFISFGVVVAIIILSGYRIWAVEPSSIPSVQALINQQSEQHERLLQRYTEPEALVIVAGTRADKWVAPLRRTIGAWYGNETTEGMLKLADTGRAVYETGTPVYFLLKPGRPDDAYVRAANESLNPYLFGLNLQKIGEETEGLWKLVPTSQPITLKPDDSGTYSTEILTPGNRFEIEVVQDGSNHNYVPNPSFELGLYGWVGPFSEKHVRVSNEQALFDEASIRMELDYANDSREYVRHTYDLQLSDIEGENLTVAAARARVMVSELHDAEALIRIIIQNENHNTLETYEQSISQVTDGFQPIEISYGQLPTEATSIHLQLGLRALTNEGSGVVYWDGTELVFGNSVPQEYCDGNHNACSWVGKPHESESIRIGRIDAITLASITGHITVLEGPFHTGDRIEFLDNAVYLHGSERSSVRLGDFIVPQDSEFIQLRVVSKTAPLLNIARLSNDQEYGIQRIDSQNLPTQ